MVTKIQTLFSLSKFNILLYIRKLTLYFPTLYGKHISWFSYIFKNSKIYENYWVSENRCLKIIFHLLLFAYFYLSSLVYIINIKLSFKNYSKFYFLNIKNSLLYKLNLNKLDYLYNIMNIMLKLFLWKQ